MALRTMPTMAAVARPETVSYTHLDVYKRQEVIQIERPSAGDTYRTFGPLARDEEGAGVGAAWIQEARNRLSMTLELRPDSCDAHEIFLGLIRESDVFIENMVWLDKLGIHDDELLRVNPALVIVHISGFGHRCV